MTSGRDYSVQPSKGNGMSDCYRWPDSFSENTRPGLRTNSPQRGPMLGSCQTWMTMMWSRFSVELLAANDVGLKVEGENGPS